MKNIKEINRAKVTCRQASRDLVVAVFRATKHFGQLEQFKYGNDIRKAATAMSSFISEGSSRSELADQTTYLLMGYESMIELLNKLVEVRKKNILSGDEFLLLKLRINDLAQKINRVTKPEEK